MRDRGPTAILLAILAILGVRALPSGTSADDGKPTGAAARPAGEKDIALRSSSDGGERKFWQPLVDFHTTGVEAPKAADKPWEGFPDKPDWDLEFLIVGIPDPIDSNAGYRFDTMVDAIQRAAEAQDYVLDQFYFPWLHAPGVSTSVHSAATRADRVAKDLLSGQMNRTQSSPASTVPEHERQPGVLLFRAPPEKDRQKRLLMVMLVGETATTGIHKPALIEALRFVGRSEKHVGKPVLILGPSFSGSFGSFTHVMQALAGWTAEEISLGRLKLSQMPQFRIISGGAQAITQNEFTIGEKKDPLLNQGQEKCQTVQVHLRATSLPNQILLNGMFRYLHLKEGDTWKARVALLVESNTSFGRNIKQQVKRSGDGAVPSGSGPGLVVFPFPMHISEVRSSYLLGVDAHRPDLPYLPSLGGKLKIPFDEQDGRETEPALHPAMTAVTSERILADMLTTIARERFRYVAITSSDVKDKIFLATLVRQYCPDAQLLFTVADEMLGHPNYSAYLKGAVVASSYPLCPKNQLWSFPFQGNSTRLMFARAQDQGTYNAAILLLSGWDPEHPSKPIASAAAEHLSEYGSPFARARPTGPPVWISIVGQNRLMPLAVVRPEDLEAADKDVYAKFVAQVSVADPIAEGPTFTPFPISLWVTPVVLFSLFAAAVAVIAVSALHSKPSTPDSPPKKSAWPDLSGFKLRSYFQPRKDRSLRRTQLALRLVPITAILIPFALTMIVYNLPLLHWFRSLVMGQPRVELSSVSWLGALLTAGILIGLVYAMVLAVAALRRRTGSNAPVPDPLPKSKSPPSWTDRVYTYLRRGMVRSLRGFPRPGQLAVVLAGMMLVYLLIHFRLPDGHFFTLLFFERATNFSSGVSPLLPVALLGMAFFCWGVCQLKRLYLLEKHSVPSPFPLFPAITFQAVHQAHRHARMALFQPGAVIRYGAGLLAYLVLFLTFCRLATRFVPTVEGVWFDSLLLLGLTLLALLLAHALLYVLEVWRRVRRLLQEVARLPMRQAYNRIPRLVAIPFGAYLSSERPDYASHLAIRERQQARVREEYQRMRRALQIALSYPNQEMTRLDREFANDPPRGAVNGVQRDAEVPTERDVRSRQLRATGRSCLQILEHLWHQYSVGETFGDTCPAQEPVPQLLERPLVAETAARAVERKVVVGQEAVHVELLEEVASVRRETVPAPRLRLTRLVALAPDSAAPDSAREAALRKWLALAEDFVALEVMTYLSQFFVQLRNLFLFLTVGSFLLLLALTTYPLQPQRLWLLFAGVLIVVVAAVAIKIFVQIERDEVVSRIAGTNPNQLNWNWSFLGHLFVYVAPLLGLLAAASTDLADLLHSWFDPLLQVLK